MGVEQASPGRRPGGPQTRGTRPTPSYELLIVVRGLRRTGKTTLISRIRGHEFNERYNATPTLTATEMIWMSPKNEVVNVTAWDPVEKALLPIQAGEDAVAADTTTVDRLKRADSLVILVDHRFGDTVRLADDLIRASPVDLPIVVFSNFMDRPGSSPVIPELLHQLMGRFYYIPGSLKTRHGLAEVKHWLAVPLLASKKRSSPGSCAPPRPI
jgi:GTPase SAR1 family protein